MQMFFRKYGVLIFVLFMGFVAFRHYSVITPKNQVIRADGKGYYAYLPALFIYHDHQMNFLYYYESKYDLPEDFAEFRAYQNVKYLDKYYAGLALLQLPFFLAAHVVSHIAGLPTDGYAPLYQQFFILGSLFYLFLGMQALMYFLIGLKIKPFHAWLAILLILFGTNCYHYAVYEQCMTHIYNLSLMCIFIYGIQRVFQYQSGNWLIISFLVLGLITILRPTNIMVVFFIPFIAGNRHDLKAGIAAIFSKSVYLLTALWVAALPILIQCALWYWQTGHFYAYSYGKEVMEWTHPKIYHILFSYRSGWFLWSPLAFIGICMLVLLYKSPFRMFSILLFMFLVVYVLSCWWTPDYGWRFGSRVFVDYLFVVAIGFALAFGKIKSVYLKIAFSVICIIGLFVSQVQAYQYRKEIITWDYMNEALYWRVFLQTSKAYEHWLSEKTSFQPQTIIENGIEQSFANGYEQPGLWGSGDNRTSYVSKTGQYSYMIDGDHLFSPVFKFTLTDYILYHDSLVQESVWFYGPQPENTRLVIRVDRGDKMISWNDMMFRRFVDHSDTWTRAVFHMPISRDYKPGDVISFFAYNGDSKERFFLDDYRVDFIRK